MERSNDVEAHGWQALPAFVKMTESEAKDLLYAVIATIEDARIDAAEKYHVLGADYNMGCAAESLYISLMAKQISGIKEAYAQTADKENEIKTKPYIKSEGDIV